MSNIYVEATALDAEMADILAARLTTLHIQRTIKSQTSTTSYKRAEVTGNRLSTGCKRMSEYLASKKVLRRRNVKREAKFTLK